MNEFELIEKIVSLLGDTTHGEGINVGPGDDAAVLSTGADEQLVVTTDVLIEGTHFPLRSRSDLIGYRAIAVNLSDIAAMGGIPEFVQVSLGLPCKVGKSAINAVSKGIFDILDEYNIKLLGGDTVRSGKIVIDVSIMGKVEKNKLTLRSGAEPGDFIIITGPVRNGRQIHLSFSPRLKEARVLVDNYKVNAMIDTSDGIAPDLNRICDESGTGCVLYEEALPLTEGLSLRDALYYGESFELLFTMRPHEANKLLVKDTGHPGFFVIGEITKIRKERIIADKKRRRRQLKPEGYCHF